MTTYSDKFTTQGNSYSDKYSSQSASYSDKFAKESFLWDDTPGLFDDYAVDFDGHGTSSSYISKF